MTDHATLYSEDSLDFGCDSSEDTEDASETDVAKTDYKGSEETERYMKEKVQQLRDLLQQLQDGTLPEYVNRLSRLQSVLEERLFVASTYKDIELEMVNTQYRKESQRLQDEFEMKKVDLKETLLHSLEEKKKQIEAEQHSVELTGISVDTLDSRPSFTRKLRRRQNEPTSHSESKQKSAPAPELFLSLTESQIEEDLLLILPPHKVEKLLAKRASQPQDKDDHNQDRAVNDIKVEDGRLYYDKKWYGRYQNVFVECRDFGKVPAVIQNICPADVILKKVTDGSKLKITIPSLQKGKYSLKRRC